MEANMRGKIGGSLTALGYFSGLVFGLWVLFLDASVLLRLGGILLLIAGLFLFPFTLTVAPLYAGFAWGDWHPLRVTIAGALMMPLFAGIGMALMKSEKA
jgi:hypothetical protein